MTLPRSEKSLLVMRHAKSDWADRETADHDRPLNERGKRDAGHMGQLLQDEKLLPDLIISSTARRARETVLGLVATSGYTGDVQTKTDFYLAGPGVYVRVVRSVTDARQRVLIVGHNPGLEELVARLTGTPTTMPTATLVDITLPMAHWDELAEDTRGHLRGVWRPSR